MFKDLLQFLYNIYIRKLPSFIILQTGNATSAQTKQVDFFHEGYFRKQATCIQPCTLDLDQRAYN